MAEIICIMLFGIFLFFRVIATMIAYEIVEEAIFYYNIACKNNNLDFDFQVEHNRVVPPRVFFIQFWNWDFWTIIHEENRDNIKANYFRIK